MRFVRITDDSTREDIAEAIGFLRAKRAVCCLSDMQAELDADVDELVGLWVARA
jgi:hypothetical protein